MKAVLCEALGSLASLAVREVPEPRPGPGEVAISVKACALNFPDVLMIQGKYQVKPPLPYSPGGEIAGVIREVGSGVTTLSAGDRVIASCLRTGGGLSEVLVTKAQACFPMPAGLDFPTASTLLVTYPTAYLAFVDRGQVRAGETVLVLGAAGGVGIAAVQVAKLLGARVIAAASSQRKVDVALSEGADAGFVYGRPPFTPEARKALTEGLRTACGGGCDVVYDPVGDDYSEPALRTLHPGGRFLVIGFAAGAIPKIPLNLPLLKQCSIVGVALGEAAAGDNELMPRVVGAISKWAAEGRIKPHISEVYPLERAAEALSVIAEGRVEGKIIVTP